MGITDLKPEPLTVYGLSVKIEDEVYELLKENLSDSEYTYSAEQIKDSVGDYYLDTDYNPDDDTHFVLVFSGIIIFIGLVFVISYVIRIKKSKKIIGKFGDTIEKVISDVDNGRGIYNKICKVFLTSDYIISYKTGLNVIENKNLLWVYQFVLKQNGIIFVVGTYSISVLSDQ